MRSVTSAPDQMFQRRCCKALHAVTCALTCVLDGAGETGEFGRTYFTDGVTLGRVKSVSLMMGAILGSLTSPSEHERQEEPLAY